MDRCSLVMIVIALTSIGHSNGSVNTEHCDDPLLCVNKPSNWESMENKMDVLVQENKGLISKTFFDPLEEVERVITGDDENCMTVTTVEKPFVIKTNVSAEIVLQSKYFEQKIRVTKCRNLNSPCFRRVKIPGFGTESSCEEKRGAVSLYIYDPEINQVRYKMFEVPVCCTCKLRGSMKK